ncbi:MAG: hypothetical protein ACLQPV_03395 [Vulcanimicrobiaceae bacterium]
MPTAFVTEIASSRKEALSALVERVHAAFLAEGETPAVRFALADAQFGSVSSVARVLKRYPGLERFATAAPVPPGTESLIAAGKPATPRRMLTNLPGSPAAGEVVPLETLVAIAAGVPRSFPFHKVVITFRSPAFGKDIHTRLGMSATGIVIGDSWWVSHRERSLTALATADDDLASTTLSRGSVVAAAIMERCGKLKKTQRVDALYADMDPAAAQQAVAGKARVATAAKAIQAGYRNRLAEVAALADLPHDLPPASVARSVTAYGVTTGPKKPAILRTFAPLGYAVGYESGTFRLSRQRPNGVTVDVSIDVGTWSRKLTAMMIVRGPAFSAVLSLPVTRDAEDFAAYPLGDAERWQQLVENLAAVVAELDRTFVPDVEAAARAAGTA